MKREKNVKSVSEEASEANGGNTSTKTQNVFEGCCVVFVLRHDQELTGKSERVVTAPSSPITLTSSRAGLNSSQ